MTDHYDKKNDDELLALYHAGDKAVGEYLIRRYHPMVEKAAGSLFLTGGDREDLVQEGNVGLYRAMLDYDPQKDASFSTFARLCIRRAQYKAIDAAGRKKHHPLNLAVSLDGDEVAVTELAAAQELFNPELRVLSEERVGELEEGLMTGLSPMEKQVLYLYLDGAEYDEIAEQLDKPKKSIDNALQRIRRKVRRLCSEIF